MNVRGFASILEEVKQLRKERDALLQAAKAVVEANYDENDAALEALEAAIAMAEARPGGEGRTHP